MSDVPLPQPGTHLPDPPSARIYLDFYRLAQAPFSITPDPGFLYYTRCHQRVLDKITYAIESRIGFTLLTGEVGTGTPTGKFFNRAVVFSG
jgi:type II secretory pathway predicted ATPase ExeA